MTSENIHAGMPAPFTSSHNSAWYAAAMERLVRVVQLLSKSHTIESVTRVVRHAARELTGADGATFVLRDGDQCFYADEDAISPLWKGQRFPMEKCVSGWVMMNREVLFIEDIYKHPRVPHDVYRQTFVKSMIMVPIRHNDPLGAIGNYWATPHQVSLEELKVLQILADTTSLALENVRLAGELSATRPGQPG
ncbi:MAG: GAF domain-containing protein [Alphaproteobacteria bacterium]|nr:GAF domain-containing protein [Alphaproteobacteria bacterium]